MIQGWIECCRATVVPAPGHGGRVVHGFDPSLYDRSMTRQPNNALRLAATAIPLRETSEGLEVLMVKRNEELTFGGMWTFPGGVLEPDDGPAPDISDETTVAWGAPSTLMTAAMAAVRETVEETGIHANTASLAWYSHWIPPESARSRFATWFFLAPDIAGEVMVDLDENSEARWLRPTQALAEHAENNFAIIAPTWCTLDDLSEASTIGELIDHAITQGPRYYHTRLVPGAANPWLVWEGDGAYESGDLEFAGTRNRASIDKHFRVLDRQKN